MLCPQQFVCTFDASASGVFVVVGLWHNLQSLAFFQISKTSFLRFFCQVKIYFSCVSAGSCGVQKTSCSSGDGVTGSFELSNVVLKTELRSFARAVHPLSVWTISPAPRNRGFFIKKNIFMYINVCLCIYHKCTESPWDQKRASDLLELKLEAWCYWKLNPGPLQEQKMLSTIELSCPPQ